MKIASPKFSRLRRVPAAGSAAAERKYFPSTIPFRKLSTIHPTKMAAATTPRSPPQQPAPGVRKRRRASSTTGHSGHFEKKRQPQLRCLPLALHPFLRPPKLHLLGFSCRNPSRSVRPPPPPPPRLLRASLVAALRPASNESLVETRL